MSMTTHIPTACLADARRVLAEQNPDTSTLADCWPVRMWRAAIKAVLDEMEQK